MKVYLLIIEMYYNNPLDNEHFVEIYSNLQTAVENGKCILAKNSKDCNFRDYDFTVTETDPIYTEDFNAKNIINNTYKKEDLGKYEPTHIVYNYDMTGTLNYKDLCYRDKEKSYGRSFTVFPEDETIKAGQKFKIGDVVKIKAKDSEDYYSIGYMDSWTPDKLYVVRWLPRKSKNQKYFDNTYALISNYNEDTNITINGLYTSEQYERDIEKYDEKVDPTSPIGFLQRIIKNDVVVSYDTWSKLKNGIILLDEKGSYKELEEFIGGNNWSLYTTTISKNDTGLVSDLLIGYSSLYAPIKDYMPKIRVHATDNYENDFCVSIEKQPKIIIGNRNITAKELQTIYDYITGNLEVLLKFWNSNAKMSSKELYKQLGILDKNVPMSNHGKLNDKNKTTVTERNYNNG